MNLPVWLINHCNSLRLSFVIINSYYQDQNLLLLFWKDIHKIISFGYIESPSLTGMVDWIEW